MVDNTIALQVRPFQMPDVGQIYGRAQNIQMNRMRMAEAQETAQERNALRGLLSSGVDINTPEGMAQLRRAAPMLAPQFEQAASQRAYQTAQTARLRAQTDADRFKLYRGQLGGVNDQAAWDDWRGRVVQEFPQFAGSIPQRFSPQARSDVAGGAELLIQRATAGGERAQAQSAREQRIADTMATFGVDRATALGLVDNIISVVPGSAGEEPVLVNKLTGEMIRPRMGAARPAAPPPPGEERPPIDLRRPQAVAPTAPPTNMMLPGATAAAAPTSVEDFYAGRRQRQVEQAGATAEAQARGQAVVRREDQPARVTEAGETAEAQARGRATVEREEREQNRQRGRESIESVLNDMVTSYRRLDELSGIPSERRSRLANVPAYLAGTAPGQEVGMAMATQSQTQRNQIQASVRQLLTAIKNATGMSAQEMNSNVELQQLLAAVSNPRQSIESVRGILTSISRQYGLGQLDFPEPAAPPPPAAPREPTPGPRRGATPAPGTTPTLEQFLAAARRANPNVSDQALTDYYNRTYGGR
jgi:hypothetical protein